MPAVVMFKSQKEFKQPKPKAQQRATLDGIEAVNTKHGPATIWKWRFKQDEDEFVLWQWCSWYETVSGGSKMRELIEAVTGELFDDGGYFEYDTDPPDLAADLEAWPEFSKDRVPLNFTTLTLNGSEGIGSEVVLKLGRGDSDPDKVVVKQVSMVQPF